MSSRNQARTQRLHAPRVLLPGGWAHDVVLTVDAAGTIERIETGAAPNGAQPLGGPTVPGMVNAHSHAFQRLIAGFTDTAENPDDSFWTWREAMYRAVLRLDADQFEAAFRHVYIEMLRAGYTSVGEFHYVHHQPDGTPYARRAELAERSLGAAADTGIALSLLPVLYAHSGFGGQAPNDGQRRFINDVDGFLRLRAEAEESARANHPLTVTGVALHSLRAVTGEEIEATLSALPDSIPVHIHVAEQQREVDDCLAWSGQRPVEWLLEHVPGVDPRWCLIHATHVTEDELAGIAQRDAVVGLCPVTEANLGDGHFPAERYLAHGGAFAIGSDSHVSVNAVEELRWLEYGQRLVAQKRNRLGGPERPAVGENLYVTAAAEGARAIGQPAGRIEAGRRADLLVLDDSDPLLTGCPDTQLLNRWLFGIGDRAIRDVWVGGRRVVESGHHPDEEAAAEAFRQVCRALVYD